MNSPKEMTIEDGIPIPPLVNHRPRNPIVPFLEKMVSGQSIFVDMNLDTLHYNARKYIGRGKYTIREEAHGFRIWKR